MHLYNGRVRSLSFRYLFLLDVVHVIFSDIFVPKIIFVSIFLLFSKINFCSYFSK